MLIKRNKQQEKYFVSRTGYNIYNLNFYHFPQFTVGKPEFITIWLFSKQRTHELTIVFLWFFVLFLFLFISHYLKKGTGTLSMTGAAWARSMTGGPWTRSRVGVHGPLVHIISLNLRVTFFIQSFSKRQAELSFWEIRSHWAKATT